MTVECARNARGATRDGEVDGERVRGLAWFARAWLDRLNLNATRCAIIRVRGESMEPTLPDGCSILFGRDRRDRREGRIYVVRTGAGLIVKRAAKRGREWDLASDNPAVEAERWPADAEVVGEVVWVARTLVGPRFLRKSRCRERIYPLLRVSISRRSAPLVPRMFPKTRTHPSPLRNAPSEHHSAALPPIQR